MTNIFGGLPPQSGVPWVLRDAEVTALSPVRVRLDGDEGSTLLTKTTNTSGLTVGARVCCIVAGRQLVVLGRN